MKRITLPRMHKELREMLEKRTQLAKRLAQFRREQEQRRAALAAAGR